MFTLMSSNTVCTRVSASWRQSGLLRFVIGCFSLAALRAAGACQRLAVSLACALSSLTWHADKV